MSFHAVNETNMKKKGMIQAGIQAPTDYICDTKPRDIKH